ncbi:universal stress protein [Methanosarcina hadiensis]|uniref:universal stress protein n=1 Tax=Methanosarcina hadiensis TaxID=3078083 RepID=UPI00397799BA
MNKGLYNKILIATDGSDVAKKAVSYGIRFARLFGAQIYVVYVIANRFGSGRAVTEYLTQEGEEALKSAREAGEKADAELETELLEGIPGDEIVSFAEKNNIDLIVMGSLGKTGLSKFLLGSVAENVIRHARTQVLVVR